MCNLSLSSVRLLWKLLASCPLAKHLVLQIIYFLQSVIRANILSALSPFHHTHITFKVAKPSLLQMVPALSWTSSWKILPVPNGLSHLDSSVPEVCSSNQLCLLVFSSLLDFQGNHVLQYWELLWLSSTSKMVYWTGSKWESESHVQLKCPHPRSPGRLCWSLLSQVVPDWPLHSPLPQTDPNAVWQLKMWQDYDLKATSTWGSSATWAWDSAFTQHLI